MYNVTLYYLPLQHQTTRKRGQRTTAATNNMQELPTILTANTYFWSPAYSASQRRRNEDLRNGQVADFFRNIGFEVEQSNGVRARSGKIEVTFSYSETCKNVYRHLSVYKDGKKSNVSAIKKLLL